MKYKKGFTLIELLVVVAIIGLLSSVVLTSLNSARMKGRDAERLSTMKQIRSALELYYDANGTYPQMMAYITSTYESQWTTSFKSVLSPYLGSVPTMSIAPPNGYLYTSTNGGQKYGLAVGLETSGHANLMANDQGYYASYYEVGPSPLECAAVSKDWWVDTSVNCP